MVHLRVLADSPSLLLPIVSDELGVEQVDRTVTIPASKRRSTDMAARILGSVVATMMRRDHCFWPDSATKGLITPPW